MPEPFLILKLKAEEERRATIKGFKDRIDILTIIHSLDLDKKFLLKIEKRYNFDVKNKVLDVIKKSNEEFKYFFPEYQNLRLLKKLKLELSQKFG